jgi:hypothetical protein
MVFGPCFHLQNFRFRGMNVPQNRSVSLQGRFDLRASTINHQPSTTISVRPMKKYDNRYLWTPLIALLVTISTCHIEAQEQTLVFSPTGTGVTTSITNWGLDTCWPSYDNMQRGLIYMGTNNVTVVRVGFFTDSQLTNNDVSPSDKTNMQYMATLAGMATAATKWDMSIEAGPCSWYISGVNRVYPDRWAAAIEACQRYYNRSIWSVEGFNEPDYTPNNEGSATDLYNIFGYLQSSGYFPGTYMEGGTTLNDDLAVSWFNTIAGNTSIGSTHCLAGTAGNYVNFIQTVISSNKLAFNPEMHNVCEAIIGANHGFSGGIWWGSAELARGSFVQASHGQQLAEAENLTNWTAAAVYRGTNGAVQAFLGGSERMATTTTYRFVSKDRALFFDGYGPQRDYAVTVPGGNGYQVDQPDVEKLVNISWGADVQTAINGRYIVVNRNSGLVLEVPGGSTNNGTFLDQNTYSGALYQQWNINPMQPSLGGGDISYFTLTAAHDGVTADDYNWSYAPGNPIDQWNGGTNDLEQWFLQYTSNGYFRICNRWSGLCLDVLGASKASGAQIVQSNYDGSLDQQWRLIPATVSSYDFVAPAAPSGLTALANPASVQLNWNANTESDLAGYTVFRSTNSGGPYDIVARGLTSTWFIDGSVQPSTTYYYVLAATDTSLNQSAYSSQVSASRAGGQTMLANYNFENTTADGSINGNNAELINSPGYATGKYGSALSLNGSGQAALVPAGIMVGVTDFTIAMWVYWNGGSAWQRIFDFGNGTTQYMFLSPYTGNNTLRFSVTTNGNGAEQQLNAASLSAGKWVQVAVTRSGNTTSLYTNGVLAASASITISPGTINPMVNYLGESQFYGDPTFNGLLDSVYIFNYALTASQLANLANTSFPSGFNWRVVNRADGKALDNYGYTTNGSGVYQYNVDSSPNQRWTINTASSHYKLQCVTGGLCLDTGGLNYNGAGLQQWSSGSSGNQLWDFVPADSGYYYITNYVTGRCVDTGGQTANGAQMQQWSKGGSWNQHWKVLGF